MPFSIDPVKVGEPSYPARAVEANPGNVRAMTGSDIEAPAERRAFPRTAPPPVLPILHGSARRVYFWDAI
jgi:hypothetical protein